MTISERLYFAIQQSGLSYREISIRTGVPKSAIQRYATGETEKIPIDRLNAISSVLGVSSAYIMGWDDDNSESAAVNADHSQPHTLEARIISGKVDSYPEETRKRILAMFDLLFEQIDDREE